MGNPIQTTKAEIPHGMVCPRCESPDARLMHDTVELGWQAECHKCGAHPVEGPDQETVLARLYGAMFEATPEEKLQPPEDKEE